MSSFPNWLLMKSAKEEKITSSSQDLWSFLPFVMETEECNDGLSENYSSALGEV